MIAEASAGAVKHCSKLRTNSKYRQEEQAALLPGVIPILELRRDIPDLPIKTLLWSGAHNIIPEGNRRSLDIVRNNSPYQEMMYPEMLCQCLCDLEFEI